MVDPELGTLGLTAALLTFGIAASRRMPSRSAGDELGAPPELFEVEVREGDEVRRLRSERPILIGRSPSTAIRLANPAVSRIHARIERGVDGINIEDLGSRNGTLLNGKPLLRRAVLEPGDRVRIGSADIIFVGVGEWK